jgi:hypothetical protein
LLLIAGSAWAQIPERNCMSDPFMKGCPAEEQSRKMQELMNKRVDLNAAPGLYPATASRTEQPRSVVPTQNPAVADTDWKRPRLAKALPPDWPRWTFAQPDPGALIGMKLKSLAQSPALGGILGADVMNQFRTAVPPVDEVWLSMSPVRGRQPESVMLLVGPALESAAADLRSKGATVCFLDERNLLVGEWSAVNRALQRVLAGAPGVLAKRAGELWSKNDLWVIVGHQMLTGLLPANTATSGITGASLGLSFQDKIAVDMVITAATPVDTTRLAAQLGKNPDDLGLGDVNIEKTVHGVSARATIDPNKLPEPLRRQIEQLRPLLEAAAHTSANKAVVIQGLDGGPKTIPAQRQ